MATKTRTTKTERSAKSKTAKKATRSKSTKKTASSKTPTKATPKHAAAQGDWWEKGIRFECQGSGKCCVSHGEYGHVWMTTADRKRMAKVLELTTAEFTRLFCEKTDGLYRLKDGPGADCVFLLENRCSVYEGRPEQCRTWPFWPEVMNAKTWKKEVAAFCPGVGKGRLYSAEEIREQLRAQSRSELDLVRGK
jgi:Fe-S-cluster containining protein